MSDMLSNIYNINNVDFYCDECYEAETQEEAENKAIEEFEKQTKMYAIDCNSIPPKKTTYRLAK